jgi:hypothetical protein
VPGDAWRFMLALCALLMPWSALNEKAWWPRKTPWLTSQARAQTLHLMRPGQIGFRVSADALRSRPAESALSRLYSEAKSRGTRAQATTSKRGVVIPIASLTATDVGRWVIYSAVPGHIERGRIKSWTDQFIYVVYRVPDDQWDRFEDYTAAPTRPEDLEFF